MKLRRGGSSGRMPEIWNKRRGNSGPKNRQLGMIMVEVEADDDDSTDARYLPSGYSLSGPDCAVVIASRKACKCGSTTHF